MIELGMLPVGETLLGKVDLHCVTITGDEPGPTVCLVAGIHGNETSSVLGLLMFLRSLRYKMKDNGRGKAKFPFKGKIVAFTGVNSPGLMLNERGIRDHIYGMEDTNRGFPGNPQGSLRDRIAHVLFTEIMKQKIDVVIDLHTGNSRSIPYIIIDRIADRGLEHDVLDYARKFGFVCCYDLPESDYAGLGLDSSFSARILHAGIPAFTVEVPGGPFAQDEAARDTMAGIMRLTSNLNMLSDPNPSVHLYRHLHHGRMYQRALGLRANKAGIFMPLAGPGREVTKGQHIGTIMNLRGDSVEELQANATGVILDTVDATTVSSGDLLFEILVDLTEDPERFGLE